MEKENKELNEKQDSIEVSRNGKGVGSWKAKLYYDSEKTKAEQIIRQLEEIDKALKQKFGGQNGS